MNTAAQLALDWTEKGRLPDRFVRAGIRRLLRARLRQIQADRCEAVSAVQRAFVGQMDSAPIALTPEKANQQHYEVPAAFFTTVLGPHLKYSGCLWPDGVTDLAQAEEAALRATCERGS
jgi:cyclopropane-fatty-acyl-phospholipid synthase